MIYFKKVTLFGIKKGEIGYCYTYAHDITLVRDWVIPQLRVGGSATIVRLLKNGNWFFIWELLIMAFFVMLAIMAFYSLIKLVELGKNTSHLIYPIGSIIGAFMLDKYTRQNVIPNFLIQFYGVNDTGVVLSAREYIGGDLDRCEAYIVSTPDGGNIEVDGLSVGHYAVNDKIELVTHPDNIRFFSYANKLGASVSVFILIVLIVGLCYSQYVSLSNTLIAPYRAMVTEAGPKVFP